MLAATRRPRRLRRRGHGDAAARAAEAARRCSSPDVALGSRIQPDGPDMRATQPAYRRLLGQVFHLLASIWVVGDVKDTQCGFKGFTREAAQDLFARQQVDSIVFDVELIHLARRRGYRIAVVPIQWEDMRGSRMRRGRGSRCRSRGTCSGSRSCTAASRRPPQPPGTPHDQRATDRRHAAPRSAASGSAASRRAAACRSAAARRAGRRTPPTRRQASAAWQGPAQLQDRARRQQRRPSHAPARAAWFWEPHDRFWVTFPTPDASPSWRRADLLVPPPDEPQHPNLVRNTLLAWRVLRSERPSAVISRRRRRRAVPVARAADGRARRSSSRSSIASTRHHHRPPGAADGDAVLIQWPEQRRPYPKGELVGPLLDRRRPGHPRQPMDRSSASWTAGRTGD